MQLAIRQACQHLPVTSVQIFWDDVESPVPDLPWPTIGYSKFANVRHHGRGWLRQQFAKLAMHRVLKDQQWLVLDADTVLRNDWNFDSNQWYYDPYENCNDYWAFAKFAVGVEPTLQRYMSPLWRCESAVLFAMEKKVYSRFNNCIENVFLESGFPTLSEVEMYAQFATQRLNQEYEFVPHRLRMITTDQFVDAWNNSNDDLCLGGADTVGDNFWQQWPEIIVDQKRH